MNVIIEPNDDLDSLHFNEIFSELIAARANFESEESGISYLIHFIGSRFNDKEEVKNIFSLLIHMINPELASLFEVFKLTSKNIPSSGLILDLEELENSAFKKIKDGRPDELNIDEVIFIGAKTFYMKLFVCENEHMDKINHMTNFLVKKLTNVKSTKNNCKRCKFYNPTDNVYCGICQDYQNLKTEQKQRIKQSLIKNIKKLQ